MTHSVMLYVNLARFAYVSLEGFACFSMLVASKRASGSTLPALECFRKPLARALIGRGGGVEHEHHRTLHRATGNT